MRGSLLAVAAGILLVFQTPASTAGIFEQLSAEPDYRRVMSFDFEKKGNQTSAILSWKKARGERLGQLSIRQQTFGRATYDEFVLGDLPRATTTFYVLPGRNVLVVEIHGAGSPGGSTYQAFSAMSGVIYRVSLVDEKRVSPLNFTEHYSAGSPARIKFFEQGARVRTLVTLDSETLERRVDDYRWDGSSYRWASSLTCKDEECPQDWL